MSRSPGGPFFDPRPPCPFNRIFVPVSTPVGTVIDTFFRVPPSPVPAQVGHRSVGTCPRPRHTGHGRFTANPPWPNEITPRPLHSGQVLSCAPGAAPVPWHVPYSSLTSRSIGTLPPRAAVRNGMSRFASTV